MKQILRTPEKQNNSMSKINGNGTVEEMTRTKRKLDESMSPDGRNLKAKQLKIFDYFSKSPIIAETKSSEQVSYCVSDSSSSDVVELSNKSLRASPTPSTSASECSRRSMTNKKRKSTNKKTTTYSSQYRVERIEDIGNTNGKPFFFVKWENYSDNNNTWEPFQNLDDCNRLDEFLAQKSEQLSESLFEIKLHIKQLVEEEKKLSMTSAEELDKAAIIESLTKFDNRKHFCDLLLLHLEKNYKRLTPVNSLIVRRICQNYTVAQYYDERITQKRLLTQWEENINATIVSKNFVRVENLVDFDLPPLNFVYINKSIPGPNVVFPLDAPIGCDCVDGCSPRSKCCPQLSSNHFAYDASKRLRILPGSPIYECNNMCKCGPDCRNRVVQHGNIRSLCIFKTSDGRGWGVKTMRLILEGQFLCEYIGEIINAEEAERRGAVYDAEGRTYLFDLDFDSPNEESMYTIDAAVHGNVSHFINHSCDPNCGVWAVYMNCLDPNLPSIALFALRRIEAGEELTFDYLNQGTDDSRIKTIVGSSPENLGEDQNENSLLVSPKTKRHRDKMQCKCGAENCRKFLF